MQTNLFPVVAGGGGGLHAMLQITRGVWTASVCVVGEGISSPARTFPVRVQVQHPPPTHPSRPPPHGACLRGRAASAVVLVMTGAEAHSRSHHRCPPPRRWSAGPVVRRFCVRCLPLLGVRPGCLGPGSGVPEPAALSDLRVWVTAQADTRPASSAAARAFNSAKWSSNRDRRYIFAFRMEAFVFTADCGRGVRVRGQAVHAGVPSLTSTTTY